MTAELTHLMKHKKQMFYPFKILNYLLFNDQNTFRINQNMRFN